MLTWRKETKWIAVDEHGETFAVLEKKPGKEWRIMKVGKQTFAGGVASGNRVEQAKMKVEGAYAAQQDKETPQQQ